MELGGLVVRGVTVDEADLFVVRLTQQARFDVSARSSIVYVTLIDIPKVMDNLSGDQIATVVANQAKYCDTVLVQRTFDETLQTCGRTQSDALVLKLHY